MLGNQLRLQEFMMLETSDLKVFGTVFPGPDLTFFPASGALES